MIVSLHWSKTVQFKRTATLYYFYAKITMCTDHFYVSMQPFIFTFICTISKFILKIIVKVETLFSSGLLV